MKEKLERRECNGRGRQRRKRVEVGEEWGGVGGERDVTEACPWPGVRPALQCTGVHSCVLVLSSVTKQLLM